MTIVDVGIDPHIDFTDVARTIVFGVDGPSMISAQLSGVNSGKVRLCLRREEANAEKQCQNMHSGTMSRAVFDAGHTEWNVSLIGAGTTLGQYATLTLRFNSLAPEIHLNSFRFNGTDDPHNNGFLVLFGDEGTADGTFTFHADIDDGHGNGYTWHFDLAVDDISTLEDDGGPSTSVNETTPITGGTKYNLTFNEPEGVAGGGAFPVFVDARLTWP